MTLLTAIRLRCKQLFGTSTEEPLDAPALRHTYRFGTFSRLRHVGTGEQIFVTLTNVLLPDGSWGYLHTAVPLGSSDITQVTPGQGDRGRRMGGRMSTKDHPGRLDLTPEILEDPSAVEVMSGWMIRGGLQVHAGLFPLDSYGILLAKFAIMLARSHPMGGPNALSIIQNAFNETLLEHAALNTAPNKEDLN